MRDHDQIVRHGAASSASTAAFTRACSAVPAFAARGRDVAGLFPEAADQRGVACLGLGKAQPFPVRRNGSRAGAGQGRQASAPIRSASAVATARIRSEETTGAPAGRCAPQPLERGGVGQVGGQVGPADHLVRMGRPVAHPPQPRHAKPSGNCALQHHRQTRHHPHHQIGLRRQLLVQPPLRVAEPPRQRIVRARCPSPTSFDTTTTGAGQAASAASKPLPSRPSRSLLGRAGDWSARASRNRPAPPRPRGTCRQRRRQVQRGLDRGPARRRGLRDAAAMRSRISSSQASAVAM